MVEPAVAFGEGGIVRRVIVMAAVLGGSIGTATAWGFVTHRIVVDNAVAGLPPQLSGFYRSAAAAISDASIEPDTILRGRDDEKEKRRHYIDLDELSAPPFRDIPFDKEEARARYGDERLENAGLLPWRVMEVHADLREAFRKKRWDRVVTLSGWLSHYLADAHQPLHTTRNHDGQESCNNGIHAAFETDLIDRRKGEYRAATALPGTFLAEPIREPRRFVFSELFRSYGLVDEVLAADTQAIRAVKRQRLDYYDEMERLAGPIARAQISRAVEAVARIWYTAWLDAGRPPLPDSYRPAPPGRPGTSRP